MALTNQSWIRPSRWLVLVNSARLSLVKTRRPPFTPPHRCRPIPVFVFVSTDRPLVFPLPPV